MEQQLTARLTRSTNEQQRYEAVTKTFSEVIQKDKHFASLLSKIKDAYHEYC